MTGSLARRGKGKSWLLPLYVAVTIVCAVLLVAGVIALVTGQPYGVWYGLGLPGLLGVSCLRLALFGVVRARLPRCGASSNPRRPTFERQRYIIALALSSRSSTP